jgi:putative addiction module antidote
MMWYNINMPKVFKNGNSLVVSVPKAYAHEISLRDGSEFDWKKTNTGLLLKPKKKVSKVEVNTKFAKMVEEFIDEHQDVLIELSKR